MIDPDALARQIDPNSPERAAIAAARAAILRSRTLLAERRSFVVETTLAGAGGIALMRTARATGFWIHLVYVCLAVPGLNVERVRERVQHGGHAVPPNDIRRRYSRSLLQAPTAIALSDEALVLDNSAAGPATLAMLRAGQVIWKAETLPEWAQTLLSRLE